MSNRPVVIRGAGEMASGTAHRLLGAGFAVVMSELPRPLAVRRQVSFAQAVYCGEHTVEGVKGRRVKNGEQARKVLQRGEIAVFPHPLAGRDLEGLKPRALVDATLAKKNTGTFKDEAPVVIGLGPGFSAPDEVHAVIETQRGHHLGRIYYQGQARPNTGQPGLIAGYSSERVMRAPAGGQFNSQRKIGEWVEKGQEVGCIGKAYPVTAPISGVIRGLLFPGLQVEKGVKLGDIDPRGCREYCFTISDKARSIGGAVLEALMYLEGKKS